MHFKIMKLTTIRNGPKQIIFASDGLGLLDCYTGIRGIHRHQHKWNKIKTTEQICMTKYTDSNIMSSHLKSIE